MYYQARFDMQKIKLFCKKALHFVTECTLVAFTLFLLSPVNKVAAEITNPSINSEFGSNSVAARSGTTFVSYFVYIWNALMVVGGIIVLFFFIQAAIEWITAGGDSGKITKARDRLLQSIIGLFILVFSFVIVNYISYLLFGGVGFDILNLTLPSANLVPPAANP
jgi:hypothetical protein